ncbi:MAG: hypothetical protein HC846_07150 [Blastocatellia bacterium]|nr:hypothetical protein [Blastocatellia bacterium]
MQTVQLQYGFAGLVIGVGLLFASALLKDKNHNPDTLSKYFPNKTNSGFYAVMLVAALLSGICAYSILLPKLTEILVHTNAETTVEEKKRLEDLRNALFVRVLNKEFTPANFYAGRMDAIAFNISYENRSGKNIRGFKGIFIFRDLFNDVITK